MKRSMLIIIVLAACFIPPCLAQGTAYFWAGGYFEDDVWHDTIYVDPDEWFDVPIYFAGGENVWSPDIEYILGARYDLIDQFDQPGCNSDFWPFNSGEYGWPIRDFGNYNDDVDDGQLYNPPGYHSLSFIGNDPSVFREADLLHSAVPIQILSFRVHAVNNDYLRGLIFTNALAEGVDPLQGPTYIGDTLGGPGYPVVTYYANVKFNGTANYGTISGVVADMLGNPIENAYIVISNEILGIVGEDSSAADGSYSIPDVLYGYSEINCSHPDYVDETIESYYLIDPEGTLNINLHTSAIAHFPAGGYFYYSHIWHDTIKTLPGEWIDIPIYFYGGLDVWLPQLTFPLGADKAIIDSFDISGSSYDFWPFNSGNFGWQVKEFGNYNDDILDPGEDYANPAGYHSLSFIGFLTDHLDQDWLHSETPRQILSFRVHIADNEELIDQVFCDALIEGMDPDQGPIFTLDTLGNPIYSINPYYACLKIIDYYEYLPGDANMYNGAWPVQLIGSDVTYLVNYFRGQPSSQPCLLDGFYAAADVNGDCYVIGSDVTKLVRYFRGIPGGLWPCPDFPTAWPTLDDLPEEAPDGWPNCE